MDFGQKGPAVYSDPRWPALSPRQAEGYVARALVLGWSAGIDRFYWYAWDNKELGLLDPQGVITPAGRAYLTTARWLVGARLKSCKRTAPVWVCVLDRDGKQAWMIWNEKDESLQWPAIELPRLNAGESLAGEALAIKGQRALTLDGRPILVWAFDGAWSVPRQ